MENMPPIKTPVAFFIFKRADTAQKVFSEIRKAKPKKLFIIGDGGRNNEEHARCLAVRSSIESQLDWDCEVHKNYSDKNLGCKIRVSSGIDWVFEQEDRAIILEDDTVPDQTFFRFCDELLEKYAGNGKIMQIAGVNFQQNNKRFKCDDSYYFSNLPQVWGWATWRRAWKNYDINMNDWPEEKERGLLEEIKKTLGAPAAEHWGHLFSKMYDSSRQGKYFKSMDTWDIQWAFVCFKNKWLSINPCVNLITNIGTGPEGTHNKPNGEGEHLNNMPLASMRFPIRHPEAIGTNKIADKYSLKIIWGINLTLKQKIISLLKKYFPHSYKALKTILKLICKTPR